MARPQRLIELLAALQAHPQTTAPDLAAELGVSVRTVLRDIHDLVATGIPVVTERGRYGGVSLLPGDQVDLSRLTTTEADLLRTVGLDLDRARQLGGESAARSALGKLDRARRSGGESAARSKPGKLDRERRVVNSSPLSLADVVTVDNRPWFTDDPPAVDVAALADALRTGHRLTLRYRRSGTDRVHHLTVDPYGLLSRGGRWYLIADELGIPRMFALARVSGWEALDEPRRLREGADLASVARQLGEKLERRDEVIVTAHLARDRLDLARRILGTRLREITDLDDGRVSLTVAYEETAGVRQLLQFGEHIEIVAPEPARRLVRDLAQRLMDVHHLIERDGS
ncbi:hypothetical protein GCM10022223_12090 [Kineosporia mesophila]|uniref:HTH deoR-type domain-containing protein n=1 Tax=Kineosporia mesophila TaxID=566012 RepID=A0ABP6Z6L3_9ACTN|nr:WYL domain-containing protein [Kineosporia mesophila]MCD5352684.1 WYL domain-containing protein [Kineosporia mesophila]